MTLVENPYDYIIVGAGSAGCVLASRLSAAAGCEGWGWNDVLPYFIGASLPQVAGRVTNGCEYEPIDATLSRQRTTASMTTSPSI